MRTHTEELNRGPNTDKSLRHKCRPGDGKMAMWRHTHRVHFISVTDRRIPPCDMHTSGPCHVGKKPQRAHTRKEWQVPIRRHTQRTCYLQDHSWSLSVGADFLDPCLFTQITTHPLFVHGCTPHSKCPSKQSPPHCLFFLCATSIFRPSVRGVIF